MRKKENNIRLFKKLKEDKLTWRSTIKWLSNLRAEMKLSTEMAENHVHLMAISWFSFYLCTKAVSISLFQTTSFSLLWEFSTFSLMVFSTGKEGGKKYSITVL